MNDVTLEGKPSRLRRRIEGGRIRVLGEKLGKQGREEAIDAVHRTSDAEVLSEWKASEPRDDIREAVEDQIVEVSRPMDGSDDSQEKPKRRRRSKPVD
jgi:hypothetical protein